MRGFPGVIGAIDCTHVPIQNPGGEDGELYRNRKGWFSINVQLMSDPDLRIRNIVASWRGSTHDSRIFNESVLKQQLMNLDHRYHLLGDKGYPCYNYLLTPLQNPLTPAERRYNFAHSSTRMVIERVNGILKRRFPCLSSTLRFTPEKCGVVIVACAVLHNLALHDHDDIEELIMPNFDQYDPQALNQGNASGVAKRRVIINNNFNN